MNQQHRTFKTHGWVVTWDEETQQWRAINEWSRVILGANEILAEVALAAKYRRRENRSTQEHSRG